MPCLRIWALPAASCLDPTPRLLIMALLNPGPAILGSPRNFFVRVTVCLAPGLDVLTPGLILIPYPVRFFIVRSPPFVRREDSRAAKSLIESYQPAIVLFGDNGFELAVDSDTRVRNVCIVTV